MIDEKIRQLNENEQNAVRDAEHLSELEKETLCKQLMDSLESTNGGSPTIKLQKVSECVEQQSRNFSMLFRSMREATHHHNETNSRIEQKLDSFIAKCDIVEACEEDDVELSSKEHKNVFDMISDCKKEITVMLIFFFILSLVYPEVIDTIKQWTSVFGH